MTYPQASLHGVAHNISITFCSCVLFRTEIEQKPTKREIWIMWFKDAAAGAGLVAFMAASFAFASCAQGILHLF